MTSFNDFHIKQLQELVTCAICLDLYEDPRILPCLHTFCYKCIAEKTIENDSFHCPLQDNTKINKDDIIELPINRTTKNMVEFVLSINLSINKISNQECDNCNENQAVNWCEKCAFYLCQSCTQSIHSIKIFQSHIIVSSADKVQSFCLEHSDEKFKYWCKQCEVLVCRDCLLFQHKDHTFAPLKEVASEAKTKFRNTAQEMDEIKRNLTTFSESTKRIIDQRHELIRNEIQNIEQTFANLQRILEERKLAMIKQFEENEWQMTNLLNIQQNTIDQYLNLTIVQELCIKKMLTSNDSMQILKFKSILSHNYKDFTEQYKKIDEGYTVTNYKFEKDNKDVEQISEIISKFGNFNSKLYAVKRDGIGWNFIRLDISKLGDETKYTEKTINYARGYNFSVKQPFYLYSIDIQSDYIGQHVGFVVNDLDVVISYGTIDSKDSTMKWLTIPVTCDIKNDYKVFVWASSGNGSYTYKSGNNLSRTINENCSVESKCIPSMSQIIIDSKISTTNNMYSIDMILSIEK